ncbi:MAG TPA: glycoside hydrolase family 3 C-terminal domain-containing protein [Prolixibacteraceae bacterium]|nr:glycoside hydrolase family 3 C-terminal domain-containing protein [Prolixibacteraceae bacterium]
MLRKIKKSPLFKWQKLYLPIMFFMVSLIVISCKTDVQNKNQSKLLAFDQQIDAIIVQLTLEEKVAMLHAKQMFTSAGIERLGIADMVYADGPFGIREEMEPYAWGSLNLATDSATFFPTGSALAATWSEELAYQYGTGMAREARLRGKDMILGPAINIQRIPTGGRTYEYFSEDPFLSARLSVGYTFGVQDNGVAACLKHYALNNQENNRGRVNVIVSPRAMREIYLPPFQAAVEEADAYGVMAAYNKVNGYWCSENDILQNKILRDEWGFSGMIISDWGGVHSTVAAALNGLDVEMPGQRYFGQALIDSVNAGAVAVSVIDDKVRNILRVRFAIEPIPVDEANKIMTAQPEQAKIAYEVASKSIVLLKNEKSLLPLDLSKHPKIVVIGDNASRTMALGGVGAGVKALYEITPLEGLKNRVGNKAEIVFVEGYVKPKFVWGHYQSPYTDPNPELLNDAVEAAKTADVVLFFAGNNREVESEGRDRISIELPYGQDSIISAIFAVNQNIITVVVAGAPVDLNVVNEKSLALVYSWFNGTEGGNALADVLLGNISPSGKMPYTLPLKLEDSPAYAMGNYPQTDSLISEDIFMALVDEHDAESLKDDKSSKDISVYSEGLLVGYRWFDTKQKPVMFPFGHGLSYTQFSYENLQASKKSYNDNEIIKVSFELSNTGKHNADEVVQLYVHRIDATVEWPFKELKAFERVSLKAGETKKVTLSFPVKDLRYWDEKAYDWLLENGEIELMVGSSSGDIRIMQKLVVG